LKFENLDQYSLKIKSLDQAFLKACGGLEAEPPRSLYHGKIRIQKREKIKVWYNNGYLLHGGGFGGCGIVAVE
jgi:hypothetical protein